MKLGRFASEVYRIIAQNDDLTAGEIFMIYKTNHPSTIRSRNEVAKRVSELKSADLVYENGITVCDLTGHKAQKWVANSVPDDVTLSTERAEETTPTSTVSDFDDCGCGCGCACAPKVNEFGEHGDIECDEEVVDAFEPETLSSEQVRDMSPRQLHNLSRADKAAEVTRLTGEPCTAVDADDLAFLRECKGEIARLMNHSLFKALAPADLKDKAKKLEKALRYF